MSQLSEVRFEFVPISDTVTAMLSHCDGETMELHLQNYDAAKLHSLLQCTPAAQVAELVDQFLRSVVLPPLPPGEESDD